MSSPTAGRFKVEMHQISNIQTNSQSDNDRHCDSIANRGVHVIVRCGCDMLKYQAHSFLSKPMRTLFAHNPARLHNQGLIGFCTVNPTLPGTARWVPFKQIFLVSDVLDLGSPALSFKYKCVTVTRDVLAVFPPLSLGTCNWSVGKCESSVGHSSILHTPVGTCNSSTGTKFGSVPGDCFDRSWRLAHPAFTG